jgi:signal transduction histidine kinase
MLVQQIRNAVTMRLKSLLPQTNGDFPLELRIEQFFITVRWFGICILAPTLLLTNLPPDRMRAAYLILGLAGIYNAVIGRILRDRPHLLQSGYITTIGDGVLNVAMVGVGGGFDGPFYFLLFTMSIAAVMRYSYGPAIMVVGMYVGLDLMSGLVWRGAAMDSAAFLFRSAFLLITTLLAGFLRDQARAAEQALASQLHQASALNESTQPLGASLELPVVSKAIVESGRHLAEADIAILHLDAPLHQTTVSSSIGEQSSEIDVQAILASCTTSATPIGGRNAQLTTRNLALADGRNCCVIRFLSHKDIVGMFIMIWDPDRTTATRTSEETLIAFVERVALTLEKALLYKALADRTDELRRAYAGLAAAHQELLSIDEMKTNFLANVSHELRTPLTAIRSFSEILLSYDNERDTQQEFISIINSESERLTRLVNDVLDITKIEAGSMVWHMDLLSMDDLLRESTRAVAMLVEEKGLSFTFDMPQYVPPVWADRDRVMQVVANLLGNAIKFTNYGAITITARVIGQELHTSITDTGIGIAPEDQKRIFEKFQQVGDTLTDKPRGTGLGLCLCRDILSHQGGRIWVHSELHHGSTFTFSLPLAEVMANEQLLTVYAT